MPERKLLETAEALSNEVHKLADHLGVVEEHAAATRKLTVDVQTQSDRQRFLTWISIGFAILAAVGTFSTVRLYSQLHDTAQTNQQNAVIACRNANDQRKANKVLWTTIFAATADPTRSKAEKELIDKFLLWIGDLYAPRDCSDLSRKYEIPPPPVFSPPAG